jgi:hypothetical protein
MMRIRPGIAALLYLCCHSVHFAQDWLRNPFRGQEGAENRNMGSSDPSAELLALQALGWLAGNDDLLPVFLSASGASLNDLSGAAQDASFLASVLDFLLADDAWVIAFCDATGHRYTEPLAARALLPGGQATHWT